MSLYLKGALIHKFDTAANWTSNNPTLLENEFGWESDTGKVKRGDGSTSWTGLGYFNIYASGASDGLGLKWKFSTGTSGTPSPGDLEFDTGTIASVGSVHFNDTGSVTVYGRDLYQGIQAGDGLFVQEVGDPTKYVYGAVTAVSNTSSITTVEISLVGYGSLPTNGNEVSVIVAYAGQANVRTDVDDQFSVLADIGGTPASDDLLLIEDTSASGVKKKVSVTDLLSGGGGISNIVEDTTPQLGGNLDMNGNNIEGVTPTEMGYVSGVTSAIQTQLNAKSVSLLPYTFDTGTGSSWTGDGEFRFDNVTPGSAGNMYFHDTDNNGLTSTQVLLTVRAGDYVKVVSRDSDNKYFLWVATSDASFSGGIVTIPGGLPYSNGSWNDGDIVEIAVERTTNMKDLVDDTTPQLGGNLDAQTNNITNIGNIEVEGHSYADGEVDDGNSSTADTINWTTGNFHKSTMTGNCTYTFTAPSGATTLILKLVQGGSGSYTATFPATVKWAGGTAPTLSTAVGAIDIITFYWDGTNYFGTAVLNLS